MPYDTLSTILDLTPLDDSEWIAIDHSARTVISDTYDPSMHPCFGSSQTEYQKQRVSEVMTGRIRSEEEKQKHYYSLMKTLTDPNYVHPHTGKPKTEQHRQNISKFHADVSGENNPMYGRSHDTSTIDKLREKAKNRAKIECTHCNKLVDASNYKRWHGDNCKEYIIARQNLGLQP